MLLVLLLLVSAPLSVLAESTVEAPLVVASSTDDAALTEDQRLALAASHWNLMPQASMEAVALMPATGMLHLALGSFDPLLGDGPEVPDAFVRINAVSYTHLTLPTIAKV